MAKQRTLGQEVRCRCGKKFGTRTPEHFTLDLKEKFRLELSLLEMPPGAARLVCALCGQTQTIQ